MQINNKTVVSIEARIMFMDGSCEFFNVAVPAHESAVLINSVTFKHYQIEKAKKNVEEYERQLKQAQDHYISLISTPTLSTPFTEIVNPPVGSVSPGLVR